MNNERYSRRALLKRMGLSAAMLPLIHAEKALGAAPSGFPKRFVSVTHGNGVIASSFYPTANTLTLGPTLASMEPFKAKMIMPIGLDYKSVIDDGYKYDGHFTYCATLTGTRENRSESRKALAPSIDQMMADDIAKKVSLKAPLLTLGIKSVGDGCSTSWRASGQQNAAELDPARLFARLFSGASTPPAMMAQVNLREQSLLDFTAKELTAFGRRLGTEDRMKIDAHLQSIRQLEIQIKNSATPGGGGVANCTAPTLANGKDANGLAKDMFNIVAIALRCDVARVVTITMFDDGGGDGNSFPWVGVNKDYHAVAHAGAGGAADKIKIDSWIYSNVANLAQQLDATMEGTGTALDNSVIATFSDMEDGASHFNGKIPITLTGSCGGYFKTGKVFRYSGVAHNKLLTSLCNAMDLPVTGVGAAAYAGNLPELST
ncbi:MAG TPA: DUF1552 domain-containing protein [Polyangia bacterium]|nr:DUF1552 domain-containing protein [Polyangia bacterium]